MPAGPAATQREISCLLCTRPASNGPESPDKPLAIEALGLRLGPGQWVRWRPGGR